MRVWTYYRRTPVSQRASRGIFVREKLHRVISKDGEKSPSNSRMNSNDCKPCDGRSRNFTSRKLRPFSIFSVRIQVGCSKDNEKKYINRATFSSKRDFFLSSVFKRTIKRLNV